MMKQIALLLCVAGVAVSMASAATVSTVDARSLSGKVLSLDKTLVLQDAKKAKTTLPSADVLGIEVQPVKVDAAEQILCRTFSGCDIPCSDIAMKDNLVTLRTQSVGKSLQSMPLEAVSVLVFPQVTKTAEDILDRCKVRGYTTGTQDMLVIERPDGKYQSATGVLLGITPKVIQFRYKGEDLTMNRSQTRAIFLSRTAAKPPAPKAYLTTTRGTILALKDVTIADHVRCTLVDGKPYTLPRTDLARVEFLTDRVKFLSRLTPTKVIEKGLLDVTFPHRVNRCVAGGPILLGGKLYANGLGLHSFSELQYDVSDGFSTFLATVGIDDSTEGRGGGTLTILADEKVLKTLTLKGGQPPVELRLAVKGAKALTIRVEFGADGLGVGDHLDLANARLVK